jgi:hypothetical protein
MAWTRTDIANRALGVLGVKGLISDVDADTTTEAKATRDVFDLAAQSLLSEFDWPMARRLEEMSLVDGSSTDPYSDDFHFAYRYSTYWMKFIGVSASGGGIRAENDKTKIAYRTISDTTGRLILTDQEDASADVLVLPEEGLYPAKYVEALAVLIAMMAGPRLAGATKGAMDLRGFYEAALSSAKAFAANEEGFQQPYETPAMIARRGRGQSNRAEWGFTT